VLGQDLRRVVQSPRPLVQGVGHRQVDPGPAQGGYVVGHHLAHERVGEPERRGPVGQRGHEPVHHRGLDGVEDAVQAVARRRGEQVDVHVPADDRGHL
jgi:hypothetical protein